VFETIASYGYSMWVLGESQPNSIYYKNDPMLLKTQKQIVDYIQNASYMQQDMLFVGDSAQSFDWTKGSA